MLSRKATFSRDQSLDGEVQMRCSAVPLFQGPLDL
jgi:hypothetical protein